MLFLALGRLLNEEIDGKLAAILASVLAMVGVAASITHLGMPLRAFNSLLNPGSSWMSRGTLAVALFTTCCVLCAAVYLWKPAMKATLRVLEIAAAVIGLVLLFIMGSIYTFSSVPAWDGANMHIEYYTTAIILGAILFFAVTYKQQNRQNNVILGAVALAAVAVQVVGSELHAVSLAAGGSAAVESAGILSANGALITAKWILLIGGVMLFTLKEMLLAAKPVTVTAGGPHETAQEMPGTATSTIAWLSVCAVVIAAFIGKVLFFAFMVMTGIGI